MAIIRILNSLRNVCIFFLCISPIGCCASFWDSPFGENLIEDTGSIFEAIKKERLGNVKRLLARGISLEERNPEGLTPLLYAVKCLRYGEDKEKIEKIILELLEQGAFLESMDPKGNTALLQCCADFSPDYVSYSTSHADGLSLAKVLLEHGADLEARNQHGETPLILAATRGNTDILKIFLEKGADIEARTNAHQTALMLAVENNHLQSVEKLLVSGACVDSSDEKGMTPLMYASYQGHIAVMQVLIQYNADISLILTNDLVVISKQDQNYLSILYPDFYTKRTWIPKGSTALTFAEECGGRGAEKILLEAWVKRDPSIASSLVEWRKKVTEL